MVSSMYIFGKVLVVKMLMSPNKLGFGTNLSNVTILNFRILASVLYLSFLEYLEGMTSKMPLNFGPELKPGADGISSFLLHPKAIKLYYSPENYAFRSEIFALFDIFTRKLCLLIVNAQNEEMKNGAEGGKIGEKIDLISQI